MAEHNCIGCGLEPASPGRSYGPRCLKRLRNGTPLDLENYPPAPPSRAKRMRAGAPR